MPIVLAVGVVTPPAHALELGVQDDGVLRHNPEAVYAAAHELGAKWIRIIVVPNDATAAGRIRAARAAGFRVILTVGGIGTSTPVASASTLLRTIRRLPRVERVSILNEPDLLHLSACRYRAVWMRVRRVLGGRLMWGDYSPAGPLAHMQRARQCGPLPKTLAVAVHPYVNGDPLAPGPNEGSLGNLRRGARWLRKNVGVRVRWVIDEFSFVYETSAGPTGLSDEQTAALWPRALTAARRVGSPMLVVYRASGPTWDSRPRARAWCVLVRRCPTVALGGFPPIGAGIPDAY